MHEDSLPEVATKSVIKEAQMQKRASKKDHCELATEVVDLVESREILLKVKFNHCKIRRLAEALLDY